MSPSKPNIPKKNISDEENSTSHPSFPLTSTDAFSLLSQLSSASHSTNLSQTRKSVSRIALSAAGNPTNRRRLAGAGAAAVLAAAFRRFSTTSSSDLLSELLSAIVLLYPVNDREFSGDIGSPESLHAIASILRSSKKKSSDSLNAVLILKQIVSTDTDLARAAARIDGLIETLMKEISNPISTRSKKAARLAVCYLSGGCLELGFFSMVVEWIADLESEKKVVEAGLLAVDRLCESELGREKVCGNALVVPVLVRRVFGCSDVATDLAVSSLWRLCEDWGGGESGFVVEALEIGVFVKLLMVLQVECRDGVKERVTKLLRFFKGFRGNGGLGCVDSFDFRGVRRPL